MGCGCKNKTNQTVQTNTQIKESSDNTIKTAVKQTVEKYYQKSSGSVK
jgi:DNA-binding protein Fis